MLPVLSPSPAPASPGAPALFVAEAAGRIGGGGAPGAAAVRRAFSPPLTQVPGMLEYGAVAQWLLHAFALPGDAGEYRAFVVADADAVEVHSHTFVGSLPCRIQLLHRVTGARHEFLLTRADAARPAPVAPRIGLPRCVIS